MIDMKVMLFMFVLMNILCCKTSKENLNSRKSDVYEASVNVECKVYKIDSIADYYLVYAESNDERYKIVSGKIKKPIMGNCKIIHHGETYVLKLHRPLDVMCINGKIVADTNYLGPMCYPFQKDVFICNEEENGIFFLYFAYNLQGLYLCK